MKEFDVSDVHLVRNVSLELSQYSRYWAYSAEKTDEVPALKGLMRRAQRTNKETNKCLTNMIFLKSLML